MLKPSSTAIAICALACAACSTGGSPAIKPAAPQANTTALIGTTWHLHEIQSMDDAQGNTRPQADRVYTMHLTPEGRAQFQLDCNRGAGAYTHQAGDADSGAISFGTLAMTRMMCKPGSLDVRVARDMGYVRSYLLRAGTLSMSLMADGGIYVWKPAPATEGAR